ncbi:MAG TPA: IPT/TIG domain-containing protein [Anaerolineales bacterium]|nr:IPT/TIG domain-containing protein [Anaerolineales bacterium]
MRLLKNMTLVIIALLTITSIRLANVQAQTCTELCITGIEPIEIPSSTGGQITVYGEFFDETLNPVVILAGYGALPTTFISTNILTATVPAGISQGTYSVRVVQSGASAQVNNRLYISEASSNSTPEPTASPTPGFSRPNVILQRGNANQLTVAPTEFFILSTIVTNTGNQIALDVTVSIASTDIIIPIDGSNVRSLGTLAVGQAVTVEWPVKLGKDVAEGPKSVKFDVNYYDNKSEKISNTYEVGLTVLIPKATGGGVAATKTPTPTATAVGNAQLIMTGYSVNPPGELKPGDQFQLELQLLNVGNASSKGFLVSIGGEDGGSLKPFAMLNSANVRYFDGINAQQVLKVTFDLIVSGKAEANIYNLPVKISPLEGGGNNPANVTPAPTSESGAGGTPSSPSSATNSFSAIVSLLVVDQPQLKMNWTGGTAPYLQASAPILLSLEISNIGANTVNISTIDLTSPQMDITNTGVLVGQLAAGTSTTVEVNAFPYQEGPADILVTVNYVNALNSAKVIEQTFSLTVDAIPPTPEVPDGGEETPTDTETPWILRVIFGFFGISTE